MTTDLGNAFLAQQSELMDAVQRMRKKAQDAGNLKSTEQQKVETKVVESKQVIAVQQANLEVVYVPTYNPTVVYGPPVTRTLPGCWFIPFDRDNLILAVAFGHGISRYLQDTSGLGIDAEPASGANTHLVATPALGVEASYQHYWFKRLRSSAIYS